MGLQGPGDGRLGTSYIRRGRGSLHEIGEVIVRQYLSIDYVTDTYLYVAVN